METTLESLFDSKDTVLQKWFASWNYFLVGKRIVEQTEPKFIAKGMLAEGVETTFSWDVHDQFQGINYMTIKVFHETKSLEFTQGSFQRIFCCSAKSLDREVKGFGLSEATMEKKIWDLIEEDTLLLVSFVAFFEMLPRYK